MDHTTNTTKSIGDVLRDAVPKSEDAEARYQQYERDEAEREARKRRERATELWRDSGIYPLHREAIAWPELRLTKPAPSPKWGATWSAIEALIGTGATIILIGPRGTGKTQLASMAIALACSAPSTAKYTLAGRMFGAIRDTFGGKGSAEATIDRFARPALLVIDEAQERSDTAWESVMLTTICDERYGHKRDTILIANQTAEVLAAAVGSSIIDRARERGGIFTLDGASLRGRQ